MRFLGLLGLSMLVSAVAPRPARADDVDFTRDVRPLLSRHCFKCHGPDEKARKAGLRLDVREEALKGGEWGEPAIVPDKADEGELVRRVFSDDEGEMMPPPTAKLALTDAQKQILKRWVESGAKYVPHWAFVSPRQVPPPRVAHADWPRNPINDFVLARMEAEGLAPSPLADKYTL